MAIPTVTDEYTPGSCLNSRNPMRHPPRQEMRPEFPALGAEQCLVPKKTGRRLDLLDGTTESPPEDPHKCRTTLISPQECQIAWCSPNQLEMTTNSPALASEQCRIPHHTGQLASLPLGNSRDSLRHPSQVYRNISFSTGTRRKLNAPQFISRRELIPRILLKRLETSPQAPQEESSLSNRYVRGTMNLLPHVQ